MASETTTRSGVDTVRAFLGALGALDVDAAVELLAQDAVYQNVSLPPARGKAAIARQLHQFNRVWTGFTVDIHRIVGEDGTVLTERTDIIEIGRWRASFWVCGTFEVRDGQIVLWRDYFDWANLLVASAVGTGRMLLGLVSGGFRR